MRKQNGMWAGDLRTGFAGWASKKVLITTTFVALTLGTGSDYTAFIDFAGIPSLSVGFSGESGGGVYHSIYDSLYWYLHFGDPNFDYGIALTQTAGRMVLRLCDADLLPFEFVHLADTVDRYVQEVTKLAETMRTDTEEKKREISDGTLLLSHDPTKPYVVPQPKAPVPYLNFAPIQKW